MRMKGQMNTSSEENPLVHRSNDNEANEWSHSEETLFVDYFSAKRACANSNLKMHSFTRGIIGRHTHTRSWKSAFFAFKKWLEGIRRQKDYNLFLYTRKDKAATSDGLWPRALIFHAKSFQPQVLVTALWAFFGNTLSETHFQHHDLPCKQLRAASFNYYTWTSSGQISSMESIEALLLLHC